MRRERAHHPLMPRSRSRSRLVSLGGGLAALALLSGTVLSADRSEAPGQAVAAAAKAANPGRGPQAAPAAKAEKPGRGPKAEKKPTTPVTVSGRVEAGTDGKGRPAYTLVAGGTTHELSAGPPWWFGEDHPLGSFVGDTVEIAGEQTDGTNEIDVTSVNGTALRAEGKPPWAGGPKVVGERHPGWKASRAEGKPGAGLGRESAPGQLKKAAPPED